jgi:hypothetical protein
LEQVQTIIISIISSISTLAILGFAGFLFRSWIIERLKASIKHEYALKMLEVEHQREIRLKGEIVSELLAQWIRKNGKIDYYELNRLSFQAFIWLPKNLAEKLSNALSHQPGSEDLRSLIKEIRIYLQESDDGFKAKDVIVFNEPDIHGTPNFSRVYSDAVIKPKPKK